MHTWVMLILLVLFLWLLYRSRQNNSTLGIGASRSRQVSDSTVTFSNVAGVDEAVEELKEIVDFLAEPQRYAALGAKIPKGVLLVGPPGTGKTLLARAVAGEAGVPFFESAGSNFGGILVGLGTNHVRNTFKQARAAAPCIVFIDEIDALGRKRGEGLGTTGDRDADNTLNQLLVEMDGFDPSSGVIVMAATNRPEILDGALLRAGRFDRHVLVGLPHREGRRAILEIHLEGVSVDPNISLDSIAARTPGFAGADLAGLINEAALLAARRNKSIVTSAEFDEAIERQMLGLQHKGLVYNDKEKRIIAYHEIGHAVVGALLENVDPLQKVTITPRMLGSRGVTQFEPQEERNLQTESELRDLITMTLGGRAAEIVFCGEATTGAQNDLAQATKIAGDMVRKFGMSPLGSRSYEAARQALISSSVSAHTPRDHGDETANSIDREIQRIVDEGLERAESLLREHQDAADSLAARLMEIQEMDGKEVRGALGLPEPEPVERRPANATKDSSDSSTDAEDAEVESKATSTATA